MGDSLTTIMSLLDKCIEEKKETKEDVIKVLKRKIEELEQLVKLSSSNSEDPPQHLLAECTLAVKAALGPATIKANQLKTQFDEVSWSVDQLPEDVQVQYKSRLEVKRDLLDKELKEAEERVKTVNLAYNDLRPLLSKKVAESAFIQRTKYDEVLRILDPEQLKGVSDKAAQLANRGPLYTDDEVLVVHQGKFTKAKVVEACEQNDTHNVTDQGAAKRQKTDNHDHAESDVMYNLRVWEEKLFAKEKYTADFTYEARLQRSKIYSCDLRLVQGNWLDFEENRNILFNKVDTDSSGKICKSELDHFMKSCTAVEIGLADKPDIFDKLKFDSDGMVTKSEWNKFLGETNKGAFGGKKHTSPEFLTLLMKQAYEANASFHKCCEEISDKCGDGVVKTPSKALKRLSRITQKATDKYDQNYSRVLDIVRTTLICDKLDDILKVLENLGKDHSKLQILRIKDRLHPEFDSLPVMGYRDLQLIVKHLNHVCEIQVTLKDFYEIKNTGGHNNYEHLRQVGLLDESTIKHVGGFRLNMDGVKVDEPAIITNDSNPDNEMITGYNGPKSLLPIWSGIVKEALMDGTKLKPRDFSDDGKQLGSIGIALASTFCFMTKLSLNGCSGLNGIMFTQVFPEAVLKQLGKSLLVLSASGNKLTGGIPSYFWKCCATIESIELHFNDLRGGLSSEVGICKRLRVLNLAENNNFGGEIPKEIGECRELAYLGLYSNGHTGKIPFAITKCNQLTTLNLYGNKLEGNIPSDIGKLCKLRKVYFDENNLCGEIPAGLGQCKEIEQIFLDSNDFSGTFPDSVWAGWPRLKEITLHGNRKLKGALSEKISSRITSIKMADTSMAGELPQCMAEFKDIKTVELPWNMMTPFRSQLICNHQKWKKMGEKVIYKAAFDGEAGKDKVISMDFDMSDSEDGFRVTTV